MADNGAAVTVQTEAQAIATLGLAIGHVIRVEIIRALAASKVPLSPINLSRGLEIAVLGNVSYHMRHLLDIGIVREVARTPRRGAVEHYYELTDRGLVAASLTFFARRALERG